MPASHVLIRGFVFTYTEKAPFAPAGKSVLGALEYDETTDRTKCHECGEWQHALGNHIRKHGLTRVDYNQRYGLRRKSTLSGPRKKAEMAARGKETRIRNGTPTGCAANTKPRVTPRSQSFSPTSHNEARNERNRCTAQLIYRIQVTAAQVGRTPTAADLRHAGLRIEVIERRFGNLTRAMLAAGLNPNVVGATPKGTHRGKPLPEEFPSLSEIKRRWEERMEWPDDYFDAAAIALERRPAWVFSSGSATASQKARQRPLRLRPPSG